MRTGISLTLSEDNAACRRCSLHKDAFGVVCGRGARSAPLMIVGETPGTEEGLVGKPFQDRGGLVLRKLMTEAGLVPEKAWLCYAIRCSPAPGHKVSKVHLDTCKHWLWEEMQAARPKVIVTLGKQPAGLLLKQKSDFRLSDLVGRFHTLAYLPTTEVAPWWGLSQLCQQGRQGDQQTVAFLRTVAEKLASC